MPLNSTQLVNKYQESLNCCLTSTSNTIDYLYGSIGSEMTGGTTSSATYEQLITCTSSANTSNGTVVFSTDYNIPLKFDSSSCTWKTIDDSRTVAKRSLSAYGMGINNFYQLSSANTTNQSLPIKETKGDWKCVWPQRSVSYNNNAFATKRDGSLWGWGCFYQQLPMNDGGVCNPFTAFEVSKYMPNICKLELPCNYDASTMALTETGTIWTWGNCGLQRGYGSTSIIAGPTNLASPANTYVWIDIASSSSSRFAIRNDNTLWAWGDNNSGQLGDGTTINRSSPVIVAGSTCDWCKIAGSCYTAGAIKTDGTLWTWGRNYSGVLGVGCCTTSFARCSPGTTIGCQGEWCHIAGHPWGGSSFPRFAAVQLDGTLWTWGGNAYGALGQGFDNTTCTCAVSPQTVVGGGTTWCKAFLGYYTSWGVKTDGTLWTWGNNASCQLGIGCCDTSYCTASPVQVTTHSGCWESVNPGLNFNFAFTYKEIL